MNNYGLIVDNICANVIVAESMPDDGQLWIELIDETHGRGDPYNPDTGKLYRNAPPEIPPPPETIISVREFTNIVGASAMKEIRKQGSHDEDYATMWDLGQMTGDTDRSSDSFAVVMADLLAAGHITQEQYDEAYPMEFRS